MSRTLTVKNIYDKKFKTWPFAGVFRKAMDEPETSGLWLIYGAEKNGKTWFALLLAKYLSTFERVIYVSAEQGTDRDFKLSLQRANIEITDRQLHFLEYIPLVDLEEKLDQRKSANVVIIDNTTAYEDELKGGTIHRLKHKYSNKLIVFIAHEEKNEPYRAAAKMVKKLAKIIVRVQGLTALVSGRCTGGKISIDETKAALYWGENN